MTRDTSTTTAGDADTHSEWEIGVRAWGPSDPPGSARWAHYHPTAPSEDRAREKALDLARSGIDSIAEIGDSCEVYMVAGPFDSDD